MSGLCGLVYIHVNAVSMLGEGQNTKNVNNLGIMGIGGGRGQLIDPSNR
jgi:hypothetical protein